MHFLTTYTRWNHYDSYWLKKKNAFCLMHNVDVRDHLKDKGVKWELFLLLGRTDGRSLLFFLHFHSGVTGETYMVIKFINSLRAVNMNFSVEVPWLVLMPIITFRCSLRSRHVPAGIVDCSTYDEFCSHGQSTCPLLQAPCNIVLDNCWLLTLSSAHVCIPGSRLVRYRSFRICTRRIH
jgi:hypothetical protein